MLLTKTLRLARAKHASMSPANNKPNPPSGIAQLRRSAESSHGDAMNLDDFIVPSSIASPSGISPSPSMSDVAGPMSGVASAIPIRKQQQLQDQEFIARASAPSKQPLSNIGGDDFSYVPRHVRKTSIDERRVCIPAHCASRVQQVSANVGFSRPKDARRRLRKCLQ